MFKTALEAFTAFWIASIIWWPITGTGRVVFAALWCLVGFLWLVALALESYAAYLRRGISK